MKNQESDKEQNIEKNLQSNLQQHLLPKSEQKGQESLSWSKSSTLNQKKDGGQANNNKDDEQKPDPKKAKIKQQYFSKERILWGTNILQILVFSWISPLMTYGYRFTLDNKSIPHLRDKDKPQIQFGKMTKSFEQCLKNNKSKREGLVLIRSIFKGFKKQFAYIFLFSFVITGVNMYQPILSHNIIDYIAQSEKTLQKNLIYFFSFLSLSLFLVISQTFFWYYFAVLGFNLSNTLSLMVYNKALKHPLITQKQFAVGDIINYSQVDAQRMTNMGYQMVSITNFPIQIGISFYILYTYIGISFLVGVGVMIVMMVITLILSRISAKQNDKLLKAKDERTKAAQEFLNIIKFIKINVLQKYFFQKVNKKRQKQLRHIKIANLCNVIQIFVYWLCPSVIISGTFLTFIALGNEITAAKAFFTIIIFRILQFPIRQLPSAISTIIQIWSSVKRLQKFLKACQLNNSCIEQNSNQGQKYAIQIQNGHFLWGKQKKQDKKDNQKQGSKKSIENKSNNQNQQSQVKQVRSSTTSLSEAEINTEQKLKQSLLSAKQEKTQTNEYQQKYTKVLENINIKFPSNEVTMIIGDIGSGKSSLLYAILNQMTPFPQANPKIKINGSIAYSAQKAWIMSGTLKQNIIFFNAYDQERFNQAIHYSCLEDDLKLFNKGVQTEIGEKGVNLSGGQKARISLARSIYANKDIYLLDDILSAVDVHVGRFIMQKTILGYLKGKTVIMPTHAISYLQKADNIVIMKKGKVIANGPYKHMIDNQQLQQVMKHQNKKEQKKIETKNKQQQAIVKELQLVREATKSKQKQEKKQAKGPQKQQYTDLIVEQLILPEDQVKGQVSIDVYLQYIKLNGGPIFIFSVLFCLGSWITLSIFSNIQIQRWCQDENKSIHHLHLFLVFAISATFFSGARAYILVMSGIRQGRIIHKKMIKSLLYASLTRFYNRVPLGRILNRLSKDLREVDEAIGYAFGNTLICFFQMLSSLLMCVYGSTPYIIIVVLFVSLFCRQLLRYYLKSQRQCVRLQNVAASPIVSGFTSTINGLGTIRAYRLQSQFLKSQVDKIQVSKRTRIARQAMQSWFCLRLALFSFLINMSSLAYSLFTNNQNASLIGLLLTYSGQLNDDFIGFAFTYAYLEMRMIAVQRVTTFCKLQPQAGYVQYCKKWRTKQEGQNQNTIQNGAIEFKNYSSRYREGLPLVLKNISLKIQKGKKVGLVGRTGAGKSTLINCLLRILEPAQGQILIDGKQIRNINLKQLRACMTMIEQQPTLINGTFRQNLDPACIYSDFELNNMIKQCNLSDVVESKGGLDGKITNQNLSVGQRQLICICRAFLKKSKIILIDEATANIDVKNDYLIQQVISKAFKNSTVITIAHRLSTLHNCDQIIVLSEGKVIEWGDTKQLMKKPGGIYRKMCEQNDSSYLL